MERIDSAMEIEAGFTSPNVALEMSDEQKAFINFEEPISLNFELEQKTRSLIESKYEAAELTTDRSVIQYERYLPYSRTTLAQRERSVADARSKPSTVAVTKERIKATDILASIAAARQELKLLQQQARATAVFQHQPTHTCTALLSPTSAAAVKEERSKAQEQQHRRHASARREVKLLPSQQVKVTVVFQHQKIHAPADLSEAPVAAVKKQRVASLQPKSQVEDATAIVRPQPAAVNSARRAKFQTLWQKAASISSSLKLDGEKEEAICEHPRSGVQSCKFDKNCTRKKCRYSHSTGICRYYAKCRRPGCRFRHPFKVSSSEVVKKAEMRRKRFAWKKA